MAVVRDTNLFVGRKDSHFILYEKEVKDFF